MESSSISPQEALPRITAILAQGRSCRLVVTGNSMLPLLHDKRDAVILAPVTEEIKRDDILFYLRSPNVCILHRVWRVQPDGSLLLCGDAQTGLEPVSPDQVLAGVSHIERHNKLISCKSPALRLWTTVWRWLYPIRPYVLALLRRFHQI